MLVECHQFQGACLRLGSQVHPYILRMNKQLERKNVIDDVEK